MTLLDLGHLLHEPAGSLLPQRLDAHLIHDAGIEIGRAIVLTALFQLGGAVGSFVLGRVLDRFLSFRVLAYAYLIGRRLRISHRDRGKIRRCCWLRHTCGRMRGNRRAGRRQCAGRGVLSNPIRATGVGWALGIGRVGSIIGPLLGGVLLSLQQETRRVFWAAAIPVLIASVAGFLASRVRVFRGGGIIVEIRARYNGPCQ